MKNGNYARIIIFVMLFLYSALPAMTQEQTCSNNTPISQYVLDWLTQRVCYVNGAVTTTDPCSCPSSGTLTKLTVGEFLPYHKWDQLNRYRHDSFLTQDLTGNYWVINTGGGKTGLNGYDVYRSDVLSQNTGWSSFPGGFWASSDGTKDGVTFTGSLWGCTTGGTSPQYCIPYGGWPFFPSTFLTAISKGGTVVPGSQSQYLYIRHWEHDAQNYPGATPQKVSTSASDNSYTYLTNIAYGGPVTTPPTYTQKIIRDSIQALHGYSSASNWENTGHLEAIYFTQLYGFTRWESWRPVAQWSMVNKYSDNPYSVGALNAATACSPGIGTYNTSGTYAGAITYTFPDIPYEMFMGNCVDYTNVPTATIDTTPSAWPVPEMNLLSNPHFTAANSGGPSTSGWNTVGLPTFTAQESMVPYDNAVWNYTLNDGAGGLHYLCDQDGGAPNCAPPTSPTGVNYAKLQAQSSGGQYLCAGSTSGTCVLYSEITLPSAMTAGNTYWIDFGALVAIDQNSPVSSGALTIVVDQIECSGTCTINGSISSDPVTPTQVPPTPNPVGPPPLPPKTPPSIVLNTVLAGPTKSAGNSVTVTLPQQITINSGTTKLRLAIQFTPQSGVIFDIPEAWLQYVPVN